MSRVPNEPIAHAAPTADDAQFHMLLESLPTAAYTCDAKGRITFFNSHAAALWGREPALRGDADRFCGALKLFAPDGSPVSRDDCWMALAIRENAKFDGHEIVIERPDGTFRTALSYAKPLHDSEGNVVGGVNIVCDITSRQRREAEIRQTEELLRAVVDGTTDAIFVKDRDGKYLMFNEAAARFVGRPIAEVLGNDDTAIFDPDSARRVMERDRRVMLSGHAETEEENLTADGVQRVYNSTKAPYRDAAGNVIGLIGISRDISDRKRAEEALRRSEGILRHAQAIAHVGSWTFDVRDGVFTDSEECCRIRGWASGPHRAEELFAIVHPEDRGRMQAAWQATLAGAPYDIEHRLVVDSKVRWVHVRAEPETDAAGRVVRLTGMTQDTTARRQLEEQFRQSQKMEAVGHLAGGVAHDFNNLLTVILGYGEAVLESLPRNDSTQRSRIAEILRAGQRAAALTRQLLAFSRKQVLTPKILDLNDVVANFEKLLRSLIGEDLIFRTALDPAIHRVAADPGQLEQVLMNLAINARDAMPTGGTLTIETTNVCLGPALVPQDVKPGNYVMLSLSDTGSGMTSEVRARAFEPFFTTKVPGQGTGLGLAMVYGIIKQSRGHIWIESEPNTGATIRICLPAATEVNAFVESATVAPADRPPFDPQGGTILLVEDDAAVRQVARSALEAHGYDVLEAAGGAQALSLAELRAGLIRLVVTDVVMPGMSGRYLVQILRARYPGLRVMFMSGYTDDLIVRQGVAETETFLQKPFTFQDLVRKVQQALYG